MSKRVTDLSLDEIVKVLRSKATPSSAEALGKIVQQMINKAYEEGYGDQYEGFHKNQ